MRKIKLSQGKYALVDDVDYEMVKAYRWYTTTSGKSRVYYAYNSKNRQLMHRLIMGNPPSPFVIDHINGNGLDNRKSNLRIVTSVANSQNNFRVRKDRNNLGVTLHRGSGKYQAQRKINGKNKYLGLFATKQLAHQAYLNAFKQVSQFLTATS